MSQPTITIDKPLISICIVTYNHEDYIEETLNSIFKQSIIDICQLIIHDDCSTDNTVEIIESFKLKYPNKIISIYQKENLFSHGVRILPTVILPNVTTKFIALCDGDDIWCDTDKLRKQLDKVSDNDADICFSSAYDVDHSSRKTGKIHCDYKNYNFTIDDVVRNGGGFMPTSSVLFKSSYVNKIIHFFNKYNPPFSDLYIQIICSSNNKITYLNQPLICYRTNHSSSWTMQKNKSIIHIFNDFFSVLKTFNYLFSIKKCSLISIGYLLFSITRYYLMRIFKTLIMKVM